MSRFYVYLHVHPETREVVYVGKGTAGRAWSCSTSTKAKRGRGNRTLEHQTWIDGLLAEGYTPADFVEIGAQGLGNQEAIHVETAFTQKYKSEGARLFNVMCYGVLKNTVLSQKQINLATELREAGWSYSKIATQLGETTMTIWRALNGRTKAYREATNGR